MSNPLPLLLLWFSVPTLFASPAPDPDAGEYFWARTIQLPAQTESKTFGLGEETKGGITFVEGVSDVERTDGRMSFTLTSDVATIGWGNYRGRQSLDDMAHLFEELNQVTVEARQESGRATTWRMYYWADGRRLELRRPPHFGEDTLHPGDRQTLDFRTGAVLPVPDGLEFTIAGEPGTRISMERIDVARDVRRGYVRLEFTLPEGEVWRATAEVGGQPRYRWHRTEEVLNDLYINGEEVERTGAVHLEHTRPVDIKRYLNPGRRNAIGMFGHRVGASPQLFVQATIIMRSGEVIRVGTGDSWRYSPTAAQGWATADFDAGDWQPVELGRGPNVHIRADDRTLLLPSYEGYIHINNPGGARLAYDSDQDVAFEVVVPEGLRERKPTLRWYFAATDEEGGAVALRDGSVTTFERRDGSLAYRIDVGRQPRGVYTIAADLVAADGSVIERRPREPVLVVGKLHQRPIEGDDWYGSLDLELEMEIDFTDLNTDRPWIAAHPGPTRNDPAVAVSQPTIIEVDGKRYQETAPRRGAFFSYRLEKFEHPGDFYLIELTYPDDVPRHLEVMVSAKREDVWTNAQSGVGAETGGRFYQSGQEQTLRWIHVADPGVHSIDVINVEDGKRAAAGAVRIYHIKGDLPSAQPGEGRLYGIFSERTSTSSGIGAGFGVNRVGDDPKDASIISRTLRDLRWYLDTAERYTQYLKFTGQNAHIMGVYQYYEYNTPYTRPYEIETSRLTFSLESVLAEAFDANDISFYAGVEWSQFADLGTVANNAQMAAGADTIWMVDADGQQLYGNALFTIVPNWIHPANRSRFRHLMSDITRKYAHLDHFKGLHFYTSVAQRWEYYPPGFTNRENFQNPFLLSYDDVTFEKFQRDTGIDLGITGGDPERFAKRAEAVQQPGVKQRFVDWRAKQFHELLKIGLEGVRRHGDDLELIGMLPLEEPQFLRMWVESGRPFEDLLKDYGYDLDLINNTEGIKLGTNVTSWRETFPVFATQDPYRWIPRTAPQIHEAFADGEPRYVMVRNSWDENIAPTGGEKIEGFSWRATLVRDGWIFNALRVRAHPQPSGFHAREAFAQVMIGHDPNLLMGAFIDLVLNVGYEQELGSMLDAFTHLPSARFDPVLETGFETNLAIRRLEHDGRTWFYVVNPGYWGIDATLHLTAPGQVREVRASPEVVALAAIEDGTHRMTLRMEPFGLYAFVVDGSGAQVRSFETGRITPHELSHMTNILSRVRTLLKNEGVRVVLTAEDAGFIASRLDQADAAIQDHAYAKAWAIITHYRFWGLWKDVMEKAARGTAVLPERYDTTPAPEGDGLRTVEAPRAEGPVAVDGRLDEGVWQGGAWSGGFTTAVGDPAMAQIGVKAAHDEENLYLAFVAADPDPTALKATADDTGNFWAMKDDAIILFLQPREGEPLYYQLGFNPAGTLFHQRVLGGARDYTTIEGWRAVARPGDGVWTAEVVLPKRIFGIGGREGGPIRVNFHRLMRDNVVEPVSWSTTDRWHDTERFGVLRLQK